MSLARVFRGALMVFAPMIAAIIISNFGGINTTGIQPLYYVQLVLCVSIFFIIAKELPDENNGRKDELDSKRIIFIRDYQEFFKGEKYIKRWIIMRIVSEFSMALSISFIPIWMVTKGASPYIFGIVSVASILSFLSMSIVAGILSDKIGRKKVFYLFTPFYCLGTLLLIIAPSPEYMILVGILGGAQAGGEGGGGIGGAGFIPFITMFWEIAPAEKRGRMFGLNMLIMSVIGIPTSIIGGTLWDKGFMIAVFLAPMSLQALVVIPLLHTIPDTIN